MISNGYQEVSYGALMGHCALMYWTGSPALNSQCTLLPVCGHSAGGPVIAVAKYQFSGHLVAVNLGWENWH